VNIYIYGGINFTNEIHKALDHSNIRFKIDDGEIVDVTTLEYLEELIIDNPHEIFLIDENKIVGDDFISKYLKFLVPKDAIEQSFLDQYGIGDISIRTYKDVAPYILKRLEATVKKPKVSEVESIDDIFEVFEDD